MLPSDPWSLELIVAGFAGGAFGAAIGALPSFALAGLLVVLGETAAVARAGLGGPPLPVDVTGAVAFGLVGALLGEVAQRVFYAHADTHLDPPAASIVATAVLIAGLAAVGVLPSGAWIPVP